jgi:hypothetical protein
LSSYEFTVSLSKVGAREEGEIFKLLCGQTMVAMTMVTKYILEGVKLPSIPLIAASNS